MRPEVSVIISLYKGERYLERFLRNITEQTWFDHIEFVIDHNAPTSRELEMISSFQRDHPGRINHLTHDDVVTYSCSWNRCLDNATADIAAIWNVDDMRTPSSIEDGAKPIIEGKADLTFGNYTRVIEHGRKEGKMVRLYDVDPFYYSRRFVFGPFFMFRRSLCEKAGMLDEQMRASADLDLAIRLTLHGKIMPMDVNMGYYLDEGKGLSTSASGRRKVEDTVIGLRYGNYDGLYYQKVPQALECDVFHLHKGGERHHVSEYVPDYERFFRERKAASVLRGPLSYAERELGQYKKLVSDL